MNNEIKYVLLDTNIFIYREGEHELTEEMKLLAKILLDSNQYKLRIHPFTLRELEKIKDDSHKKACLSRASIYTKLSSPPIRPDSMLSVVGPESRENDFIDNCILHAIVSECADYLITNDFEVIKKAIALGIKDRVLSINDAISLFREKEVLSAHYPAFLEKVPFNSIDLNDPFFDGLKDDYAGFEVWFNKKKKANYEAYVSYLEDKRSLGSFLSLKIENETEDYKEFDMPFEPKNRVKVSTMKVVDTGKRIGETFIKIMTDFALINSIDEIYVTIFPRHVFLISLLEEYGFKYYTFKNTKNAVGEINKENVYVKKLGTAGAGFYPILDVTKNAFIVPIRPEYHELLFAESEKLHQISLDETQGEICCSNSIKKAYLSSKEFKMINPGDTLYFYLSETERAITSVGVVDEVYNSDDFESFEEFKNKVKKRTVYDDTDLKSFYDSHSFTLLMFKFYFSFDEHVSYDILEKNNILSWAPISIQSLELDETLFILENGKVSDLLLSNK